MFPEGFSIAISTLVGNEMGSNRPNRAKRFGKYGAFLVCMHYLITMTPIYMFREQILRTFSVDEEVYNELSNTFFFFVCSITLDAIQVTLSALMRAIGKEKYSTVSFFIGYILIGVTFTYFLAYPFDFQLDGIWIGFSIGNHKTTYYISYSFINK